MEGANRTYNLHLKLKPNSKKEKDGVKQRIAVIVLVLAMVSWIVLFSGHLQAFKTYQQDWVERIGSEPDFEHWWSWGNGYLFVASAFLIFLGWTFTITSFRANRKGKMTTLS